MQDKRVSGASIELAPKSEENGHSHGDGKGQDTKITTDSQRWKDATGTGGKTTLQQQMNLARTLYNEACVDDAREDVSQVMPTQELLGRLEQAPVGSVPDLVIWKGIRVGWILDTFAKLPFLQKLRTFGCQLWFVRKVCIIEMMQRAASNKREEETTYFQKLSGPFAEDIRALRRQHQQQQQLSGPFVNHIHNFLNENEELGEVVSSWPTHFLSYTGEYTLDFLLDALSHLDPDAYVWMDIFCVDQFVWTGRSRSSEMQAVKGEFMDNIQRGIARIQKTVLVLEKYDNVMKTLKQIWVLWEIFNTARSGAKLQIVLSQEQTAKFIKELETRHDALGLSGTINSLLASIDVREAESQDENDRSVIFKEMRKIGLGKVNSVVVYKMRAWFVDAGEGHAFERVLRDCCFVCNPSPLARTNGDFRETPRYLLGRKGGRDLLFLCSEMWDGDQASTLFQEFELLRSHPNAGAGESDCAQGPGRTLNAELGVLLLEEAVGRAQETLASQVPLNQGSGLQSQLQCVSDAVAEVRFALLWLRRPVGDLSDQEGRPIVKRLVQLGVDTATQVLEEAQKLPSPALFMSILHTCRGCRAEPGYQAFLRECGAWPLESVQFFCFMSGISRPAESQQRRRMTRRGAKGHWEQKPQKSSNRGGKRWNPVAKGKRGGSHGRGTHPQSLRRRGGRRKQ